MKNKRGFLLGEYTLKLIIAVLCISLLFYLLFSLYAGYNQDKDLRLAKGTLDQLIEKMNVAKETKKEQKMVLLEPSGWLISSFTKTEKPLKCNGNCICICSTDFKNSDLYGNNKEVLCNNEISICKTIDENLNEFNYYLREKSWKVRVADETAKEFLIKYKEGEFTIINNEK